MPLNAARTADLPAALAGGALVVLLVCWRDAFVARSDPPSTRQGLLTLAALAVLLPLYGVTGFFILRHEYAELYTVPAALKETGARLLFSGAGAFTAQTHRTSWFLDSIPLLGWTGLLVALATLLRGRLAPAPAPSDRERAERLLRAHGRSGTSSMTLWEGNAVFLGPGGAAYIGYRLAGGVALALGDPIGPDEAVPATIAAFDRFCREQGWEHAFYAATPRVRPVYERLGYRALKVGEEALIPLTGLDGCACSAISAGQASTSTTSSEGSSCCS